MLPPRPHRCCRCEHAGGAGLGLSMPFSARLASSSPAGSCAALLTSHTTCRRLKPCLRPFPTAGYDPLSVAVSPAWRFLWGWNCLGIRQGMVTGHCGCEMVHVKIANSVLRKLHLDCWKRRNKGKRLAQPQVHRPEAVQVAEDSPRGPTAGRTARLFTHQAVGPSP